jgi:DNA mismatch endonuclease (patch repair protein)
VKDFPVPLDEGVTSRMASQSRRDTLPEMLLRRELHRRGLRYRVDRPVLPDLRRRRPDIVFSSARVAVFVDGCFWHRCPVHAVAPKNNRAWWRDKLQANVDRDRDTDDRLAAAGWRVIRVWEHEDPVTAADRIEEAVRTGPR